MAILTSYKNVSVGYIELKLHIYGLGTSETYFTSCKNGHNRSPLKKHVDRIEEKKKLVLVFQEKPAVTE